MEIIFTLIAQTNEDVNKCEVYAKNKILTHIIQLPSV